LATTLALALAPTGALGWAQDANGKWIANNHIYDWVGGVPSVHEACTYRNTNNLVPLEGVCGYWTNSNGGQFWGRCWYFPNLLTGKIGSVRCQ
ncbi:hypothetical protein QBC34DRAFT_432617, partial [Podospora aff. communis PSN243]